MLNSTVRLPEIEIQQNTIHTLMGCRDSIRFHITIQLQ